MTNETPPQPPDPGGLQFDRVESTQPIVAICSGCKGPLGDPYYIAAGSRICSNCKTGVSQYLESGSKGGRFLKAALFGGIAALVGGGLWATFIMTVKSMWGVVAIGLGYLVGIAVRKGSEGRGGRTFQFLGLGLVYLAVATGYMGVMITEMDKKAAAVTEITTMLLIYASAPILMGKADPYSLLFLGIALWEAWRLNRGGNLKVSGPFRAGGGAVGG